MGAYNVIKTKTVVINHDCEFENYGKIHRQSMHAFIQSKESASR